MAILTTYGELLEEIEQHVANELITEDEANAKRQLIKLRISRETRDRAIA